MPEIASKIAVSTLFIFSSDERIHVSPGFGVGALRIKSGDSYRDLVCVHTAERHKFPTPNPRKHLMKNLALDLGKFNTMCCFFDSKSKKHSFLNASTTREELTVSSKKKNRPRRHGGLWTVWLDQRSSQTLGHKTIVCSTNEDAWRWTNVKRKTDKDDALKLARMASRTNCTLSTCPQKRTANSALSSSIEKRLTSGSIR